MQFYINKEIHSLAQNSYLEDFLTLKSSLQNKFENDAGYSGEVYREMFRTLEVAFAGRFPTLEFNDFLFMHGVPVNLPAAKAVLMLLKYGSDCLVFVDRPVLRWVIGDKKSGNLQRYMRNTESYIEQELKRQNIPVLKFSRIEKAEEEYRVNKAFCRFTRSRFPNSNLSGILVDVNFFFTRILTKVKSETAIFLFDYVINIFKANVDYTKYLTYKEQLAVAKLVLATDMVPTSSLNSRTVVEDDDDYDTKAARYAQTMDNENINICKSRRVAPHFDTYESIVADALDSVRRASPQIPDDVCETDEPDNQTSDEVDDDDDIAATTAGVDVAATADIVMDGTAVISSALGGDSYSEDSEIFAQRREFELLCDGAVAKKEIMLGSLVYFVVKSTMSQRREVLKEVQKTISSVCLAAETKERFCVLLYFNVAKKSYHLMTRQIRTAKGVLIQQKDILVCGWSGINKNVTKTIVLNRLKAKNQDYDIKQTQIFGLPNLDVLRKDLLSIVMELRGAEEVCKPPHSSPNAPIAEYCCSGDVISSPVSLSASHSLLNYTQSSAYSEADMLNFGNIEDKSVENPHPIFELTNISLNRTLNTPSPCFGGPPPPVADIMLDPCSPALSCDKTYMDI